MHSSFLSENWINPSVKLLVSWSKKIKAPCPIAEYYAKATDLMSASLCDTFIKVLFELLATGALSLPCFGAVLLLLDFASTSVVSVATAAAYAAEDATPPFPMFVGTIVILVIVILVSLSGVKGCAHIALSFQLVFSFSSKQGASVPDP